MSDESLTPDEFVKLKKDEVEGIFEKSLPAVNDEPYFVPGDYDPATNALLAQMKAWKMKNIERAAERKSILVFAVPSLLVGPGVISAIFGNIILSAVFFTIGTMTVTTFMWIFGKLWSWETKQYEKNTETAEGAIARIRDKRAREWAEARYDMNTISVEWAEFRNLYIDGGTYRWKELPGEERHFILFDVDAEQEVPLISAT